MTISDERFIAMIQTVEVDDAAREDHREQLKRRVLEAFDTRAAASRSLPRPVSLGGGSRALLGVRSSALAASLAICAALGILSFVALSPSSALALPDLGRALRAIHSARYSISIKTSEAPAREGRVYVQVPGRERKELSDGVIRITDLNQGRILELNATKKTADVFAIPAVAPERQVPNAIEGLRILLARAEAGEKGLVVKPLGVKHVDGRHAVGFLITTDGDEAGDIMSYTIWGDRKTALPVRVEEHMKVIGTTVVMTGFEYDVDLAADLFSLDIPDGYRTQTARVDVDLSLPDEKDLITSLRLYAENGDGTLPSSLDDGALSKLIAVMVERAQAGQPASADPRGAAKETARTLVPLSMKIGRGQAFVRLLQAEANPTFAKGPVKLGDAEQPVFWYKPDGENHYRVIYGDLSVKVSEQAPSGHPGEARP